MSSRPGPRHPTAQPSARPGRERHNHPPAPFDQGKMRLVSAALDGRASEGGYPFLAIEAREPMFARRFAVAIAVLAGLIGSQAPEFAQQPPPWRLGARRRAQSYPSPRLMAKPSAKTSTPSRGPDLARRTGTDDPLARPERGEDMAEAMERAKRLTTQLEAMNSDGPTGAALPSWPGDFDPDIARSTLGVVRDRPRRSRLARSRQPA